MNDSAEYECHVDSFYQSGYGIGEVDVRDMPVIFTSKSHVSYGQPYTITWKPKVRSTTRGATWQLRIRKSGTPWDPIITRGSDQMFYQIKANELEANTPYDVSVVSVRQGKNNRKITGKRSDFTFQVGKNNYIFTPSPPTLTTVTEAIKIRPPGTINVRPLAHAAELSWPANSNADSYSIILRQRGAVKTFETSEGSNYKLLDLSPSSEYTVRVTTIVGDLQSDYTEKDFVTRPNPPRDATFLAGSNQNVVNVAFNWKGNALSYTIKTESAGNVDTSSTSDTNYSVQNLHPGAAHKVSIVATDRFGTESLPQNRNNFDLKNVAIMANNLQNSIGSSRHDQTAAITWSNVDIQSNRVKEWIIEWNGKMVKTSGANLQYTIQDLRPYQEYAVQLTGTLDTGAIVAHTLLIAQKISVTNFRVHSKTSNGVILKWNAPSDLSSLKEYEIVSIGSDGTKAIVQVSPDISTRSFDTLDPNSDYTFSIVTISEANERGDPVYLEVRTDQLAPISPPVQLHQSDSSKNTISVSWTQTNELPTVLTIEPEPSNGASRRRVTDSQATFTFLDPGKRQL